MGAKNMEAGSFDYVVVGQVLSVAQQMDVEAVESRRPSSLPSLCLKGILRSLISKQFAVSNTFCNSEARLTDLS